MRKHVRATCRFITHLQRRWKKRPEFPLRRRETGRTGRVAERGGEGREARCSLLWHILEKVSDSRRDNGPSRERETV